MDRAHHSKNLHNNHRHFGHKMEEEACKILTNSGLKLVQKNFNCKVGEIDLIMQDGKELVFIEVRYRKNFDHHDPLESITEHKVNKICRAAEFYLQKKGLLDKVAIRFDVFALSGGSPLQWTWVKQAFD